MHNRPTENQSSRFWPFRSLGFFGTKPASYGSNQEAKVERKQPDEEEQIAPDTYHSLNSDPVSLAQPQTESWAWSIAAWPFRLAAGFLSTPTSETMQPPEEKTPVRYIVPVDDKITDQKAYHEIADYLTKTTDLLGMCPVSLDVPIVPLKVRDEKLHFRYEYYHLSKSYNSTGETRHRLPHNNITHPGRDLLVVTEVDTEYVAKARAAFASTTTSQGHRISYDDYIQFRDGITPIQADALRQEALASQREVRDLHEQPYSMKDFKIRVGNFLDNGGGASLLCTYPWFLLLTNLKSIFQILAYSKTYHGFVNTWQPTNYTTDNGVLTGLTSSWCNNHRDIAFYYIRTYNVTNINILLNFTTPDIQFTRYARIDEREQDEILYWAFWVLMSYFQSGVLSCCFTDNVNNNNIRCEPLFFYFFAQCFMLNVVAPIGAFVFEEIATPSMNGRILSVAAGCNQANYYLESTGDSFVASDPMPNLGNLNNCLLYLSLAFVLANCVTLAAKPVLSRVSNFFKPKPNTPNTEVEVLSLKNYLDESKKSLREVKVEDVPSVPRAN